MEVENVPKEKVETSVFACLFNTTPQRKVNKNTKWGSEIDAYKKEDRAHIESDPLLWWKLNQHKYPGLGTL